MHKMLELESVLWNLSTFGGAFSSMGDYDPAWVGFYTPKFKKHRSSSLLGRKSR